MKTVRFVTEFVSPSLGNVWIGRIMALPIERAEQMVKLGYAENLNKESAETEKAENGDSKHIDADGSQEPPADRPKRRGRPPANLS